MAYGKIEVVFKDRLLCIRQGDQEVKMNAQQVVALIDELQKRIEAKR